MSHDDLRAQYERLKAQIAELQKGQRAQDNPEVHELLQKMQTLTDQYDQKLSEVEAQMAELRRELFGPKADKLTREQQDQMNQLLQDIEADAQVSAPESDDVLVEEGFEKRDKKQRGRSEDAEVFSADRFCDRESSAREGNHRCISAVGGRNLLVSGGGFR